MPRTRLAATALLTVLLAAGCANADTPSTSTDTPKPTAPSTGAPSTGAPSTGAPSTGAPSTGAASSSPSSSTTTDATGDLAIGAQPQGGIDLAGTSWTLTSPLGTTATTGVTLTFEADKASGQAPVNAYTSSYTSDTSGDLTFTAVATTRMAGSPEDMAAEQEYIATLSQTFAYTADKDTLTLYGVADQVTEFTAN